MGCAGLRGGLWKQEARGQPIPCKVKRYCLSIASNHGLARFLGHPKIVITYSGHQFYDWRVAVRDASASDDARMSGRIHCCSGMVRDKWKRARRTVAAPSQSSVDV